MNDPRVAEYHEACSEIDQLHGWLFNEYKTRSGKSEPEVAAVCGDSGSMQSLLMKWNEKVSAVLPSNASDLKEQHQFVLNYFGSLVQFDMTSVQPRFSASLKLCELLNGINMQQQHDHLIQSSRIAACQSNLHKLKERRRTCIDYFKNVMKSFRNEAPASSLAPAPQRAPAPMYQNNIQQYNYSNMNCGRGNMNGPSHQALVYQGQPQMHYNPAQFAMMSHPTGYTLGGVPGTYIQNNQGFQTNKFAPTRQGATIKMDIKENSGQSKQQQALQIAATRVSKRKLTSTQKVRENFGESPPFGTKVQSVDSEREKQKNKRKDDRRSKPRRKDPLGDPAPDRPVNPLLEIPIHEGMHCTELWALSQLYFYDPDTFPISYLATLLGFDLENLKSTGNINVSNIPLMGKGGDKIDPWLEIPCLGDAYENMTVKRRRIGRKESFDDDSSLNIVDPNWSLILLSYKGFDTASFRPAQQKPISQKYLMSSQCIEYARKQQLCCKTQFRFAKGGDETLLMELNKECGVKREPTTFEGLTGILKSKHDYVIISHINGVPTGYVHYKICWYRPASENPNITLSNPSQLVIYINNVMSVKQVNNEIGGIKISLAEPRTGVVLSCLAFEHARYLHVCYGMLDACPNTRDFFARFFRMNRIQEDNNSVVPMVCDLNKCSYRYSLLLRKENAGRTNSTFTESISYRLLLKLPTIGEVQGSQKNVAETKKQDGSFVASNADETRVDKKIELQLELPESYPSNNQQPILKKGCNEVGDRDSEINYDLASWKCIRSFQMINNILDKPEPSSDVSLVDVLKRKQEILTEVEKKSEPTLRNLFEKAVELRVSYEVQKAQKVDDEAAEKKFNDLIKFHHDKLEKEIAQKEADMNAVCEICRDGEVTVNNQILFCDACNVPCHQKCYGISEVPAGEYFCKACRFFGRTKADSSKPLPIVCELCPIKTGAFVRTGSPTDQNPKWVHVMCAKWQGLNYLNDYMANDATVEGVQTLKNQFLWEGTHCFICKGKRGAYNKCRFPGCNNSLHVSCARYSNICTIDHGECHTGPTGTIQAWTLCCPIHSEHPVGSEKGNKMSVEDLIKTAKTFPPEIIPPKPRPKPGPFRKMVKDERDFWLKDDDFEQDLIKQLLEKTDGAFCAVCSNPNDPASLVKCNECGIFVHEQCYIGIQKKDNRLPTNDDSDDGKPLKNYVCDFCVYLKSKAEARVNSIIASASIEQNSNSNQESSNLCDLEKKMMVGSEEKPPSQESQHIASFTKKKEPVTSIESNPQTSKQEPSDRSEIVEETVPKTEASTVSFDSVSSSKEASNYELSRCAENDAENDEQKRDSEHITTEHKVPSCHMCTSKGGALKPAFAIPGSMKKWKTQMDAYNKSMFKRDLWCHVLCALWHPHCKFEDPNTLNKVDCTGVIMSNGITHIDGRKRCALCGISTNVKVVCSDRNPCYKDSLGKGHSHYFHVTCARQAGLDVGEIESKDTFKSHVRCLRHSRSTYNLRARLEDLLELERGRANQSKALTSQCHMSQAHAARVLHFSISVMQNLGWAWRWAEWWVEHGDNWEPLLEPGQNEKKMTKEELKIIDTTKESRCQDARKCRLAAFGAALRNRDYDKVKGDNRAALERGLRAILSTPSIVGPLIETEVEFLITWLGMAYRSKSSLLGFGDDQVPVSKSGRCVHIQDGSLKSQLGSRSLPGKLELPKGQIYETGITEVDDFLKEGVMQITDVPKTSPMKKTVGSNFVARRSRRSSPNTEDSSMPHENVQIDATTDLLPSVEVVEVKPKPTPKPRPPRPPSYVPRDEDYLSKKGVSNVVDRPGNQRLNGILVQHIADFKLKDKKEAEDMIAGLIDEFTKDGAVMCKEDQKYCSIYTKDEAVKHLYFRYKDLLRKKDKKHGSWANLPTKYKKSSAPIPKKKKVLSSEKEVITTAENVDVNAPRASRSRSKRDLLDSVTPSQSNSSSSVKKKKASKSTARQSKRKRTPSNDDLDDVIKKPKSTGKRVARRTLFDKLRKDDSLKNRSPKSSRAKRNTPGKEERSNSLDGKNTKRRRSKAAVNYELESAHLSSKARDIKAPSKEMTEKVVDEEKVEKLVESRVKPNNKRGKRDLIEDDKVTTRTHSNLENGCLSSSDQNIDESMNFCDGQNYHSNNDVTDTMVDGKTVSTDGNSNGHVNTKSNSQHSSSCISSHNTNTGSSSVDLGASRTRSNVSAIDPKPSNTNPQDVMQVEEKVEESV